MAGLSREPSLLTPAEVSGGAGSRRTALTLDGGSLPDLQVVNAAVVPEHDQPVTHRYVVHYPAHDPRAGDPHRHDFEAWKKRRRDAGTYYCDFAKDHRGGDTSECDLGHPLEAHHKVIELAMLNEIDFALLDRDFPGISAQSVGAWIDSDANLTLLCATHHRGAGGVHVASYADFGGEFYIRNLISRAG